MTHPPHQRHALLGAIRERELLRQAQAGSAAARARLMEAFFPFVRRQAAFYGRRKGLDPDDAEGEAVLAIPAAIASFDLDAGGRFSTYLAHRIRGAITAAARAQTRATILDVSKGPGPQKLKPLTRWEQCVASTGRPLASFWPNGAVEYVRGLRRRNDRLIAKWLWLDWPPRRQADIARRLGISRSAVTQRRQHLEYRLKRKFGNIELKPFLRSNSLNTLSWWDILEADLHEEPLSGEWFELEFDDEVEGFD